MCWLRFGIVFSNLLGRIKREWEKFIKIKRRKKKKFEIIDKEEKLFLY